MNADQLLDIPKAAQLMGVSRATVYRMLAEDEPMIRSVHIGRRHLIPVSEINRFIRSSVGRDEGAPTMGDPIPSGDRIRLFRLANGCTVETLAGYVQKSAATVTAWEAGRSRPSPTSVERIAAAFGVTVQQLCAESVAVA